MISEDAVEVAVTKFKNYPSVKTYLSVKLIRWNSEKIDQLNSKKASEATNIDLLYFTT